MADGEAVSNHAIVELVKSNEQSITGGMAGNKVLFVLSYHRIFQAVQAHLAETLKVVEIMSISLSCLCLCLIFYLCMSVSIYHLYINISMYIYASKSIKQLKSSDNSLRNGQGDEFYFYA